ncbi:site-specific integrase [uncultured Rhodoblastus sp.]|uniref:tyrosine-type recombinase/integrase n=1 Tax=uncultured Rhodoblastus sp. TaxID=543037 RepID=UPI0025EC7122|nr:site-specific integrase [uncultured Rhodoblastus sp.]
MKLIQKTFRFITLPDGVADKIFFDDALAGFGLRIREGGKRTWIAQYRVGAAQRRVTLGTVETLDADAARKAAKEVLAKVHLGHDPQADKIEARKPKPKELTVGDAVETYLQFAEQRLKPSTYYGVDLHLRKHWKALHIRELRGVARQHVATELGKIATNSGPIGANRSRAALSAFFSWAMGEGLADANPVIGTNKAANEVARDRVLTDGEIGLIWRHAGGGDYGAIVRVLILTGQRREEVGGMLWSELDLDVGIWRIGAARTKNARPHDVPLAVAAVSILKGLIRREGRDLVFGAGDGSFSGWSKGKSALDGRITNAPGQTGEGAKLTPWRLHDLRRTCATRMADLGVLPHVIEAVLNHISGSRAGVAGVYNRSSYTAEKKAALILWGDHVAAMVEGV